MDWYHVLQGSPALSVGDRIGVYADVSSDLSDTEIKELCDRLRPG